jgi:hypothetical protein
MATLDEYMSINVDGICVYLHHRNMVTLREYMEGNKYLRSFRDLLEYCKAHGITLFFRRAGWRYRRTERRMLKLLRKYPETIMSLGEITNLLKIAKQFKEEKGIIA